MNRQLRPFQQPRFDEIPDLPRVAHTFFDLPVERTRVTGPRGEVEIAWRQAGSGPPLVLLHGLMTSGYSWRYVLAPLAERYQLYIPDLVGAGLSEKAPGPYTPHVLAHEVGAWIRAVGIEGTLAVGNSMGGYLLMQLALTDPRAMRALINVHSPGLPTPRMLALYVALRTPGAARLLRRLIARDPERWAFKQVHYQDETLKSREEAIEYARPLRDDAGVSAFISMLTCTLGYDALHRFESELARRRREDVAFPIPLHLVYAPQDPVVPPAIGRRLRALIPDADFTSLASGSHFAHVDSPADFLGASLPWLERYAP